MRATAIHALVKLGLLLMWPCRSDAEDDVEALQQVFEAEIAALDAGDLEGALSLAHDGIVLFGIFSPFPANGKEEFKKTVQAYFATYDDATFSPVDPRFRVVGGTGIAWGNYQLAATPKGGVLGYSHGRYIFSYAKVDGKWMLLSMHISPLQPYRYGP